MIRRWIWEITAIALILLTCGYIYGAKIEPNWIEIVEIDLAIPHLSPAFADYKLVQISDLHQDRFMPESRWQRIIKLVNQQHPDAIAITGDFVSGYHHFNQQQLTQHLSQLSSRDGTFAVLGNHDHQGNAEVKLKQILSDSQINNLDNQVNILQKNQAQLVIAGIDDPYWGKPDLDRVLSQLPPDVPAILLVHEPDYIEQIAQTNKFVLQLSGHSHGGQIRLPFVNPPILPRWGQKYFAGLHQVQNTLEYTNRGLGMTKIPIRIASRPEITVFTFKSQA